MSDDLQSDYGLPPINNGDFVVGEKVLPPLASTPGMLRASRFSLTQFKVATYFQYWITRELQSAWRDEIANLVDPTTGGPIDVSANVCNLTQLSFVPIDQWATSSIVTFPLINVVRTGTEQVNETIECDSALETYGCLYILPPAATLDQADLFHQICNAVGDTLTPCMMKNTIDGVNRYFLNQNQTAIKAVHGALQTPSTASKWMNSVGFDVKIRSIIYSGGGSGNPGAPPIENQITIESPIADPSHSSPVVYEVSVIH